MRGLTKTQCAELEELKLHVLSNLKPMSEVTDEVITQVIGSSKKMPQTLQKSLSDSGVSLTNLTVENFRRKAISCYIECILGS